MKNLLFVFGTRPEAIKLAPLIRVFQADPAHFVTRVCVTAQHREMLDDVLNFFRIKPDYDLNIMKPNQSLFDITADGLKGIEDVLSEYQADNIFVEGDTTTVLIGSLAGFYTKTTVSHVEAGLRSGNKYSPFPEEMNRILAGHLADFHFAPTEKAATNLFHEGIRDNVWVVGNTVIDALFMGLELISAEEEKKNFARFGFVDFSRKIVLVTCHRRESFGAALEGICQAIRELANNLEDIEIIYPVHLNPNVREPAFRILGNTNRVHLMDPLNYAQFIWLMNKSHIILTDSGGVQEEAPSLGKPVLVMRDVTERVEGIEVGTARLVGTDRNRIVEAVYALLRDRDQYEAMAKAVNPYGDGKASERIKKIIAEVLP
jgi:UDP-N-acetylglucosamine 2-epimerase (non-hydrolysing)